MTIKIKTVIFSHLSDIQTGYLKQIEINNRANFIKWLLNTCPNIDDEIDVETMWAEFTETRFYKEEN